MKVLPLYKYQTDTPMGATEARLLLTFTLHDHQAEASSFAIGEIEPELEKLIEGNAPFPTKIFISHLSNRSPETKMSVGALAFLAFVHLRNPGNAVMWAYTVHRIAETTDFKETVDLTVLTQFFPSGFPTESTMEIAWDDQKGGDAIGGNLLDISETWYEKGTT